MMTVTNVRWLLDQHGRPALDLDLDGHPAHIRSSQKTKLLQRGMVDGMSFLASERAAQLPNIHIHGDVDAAYAGDLVGATNDPQVFALYQDMSEAIRRDTWQASPRPATVSEPSMDPQAPQGSPAASRPRSGRLQRRTTTSSTPRVATSSHQGVKE
jgi:hypothetical protein